MILVFDNPIRTWGSGSTTFMGSEMFLVIAERVDVESPDDDEPTDRGYWTELYPGNAFSPHAINCPLRAITP
ncbi:hypothetical protein NMY22_g17707 [Coprinellus aureogranulatus]|nr:hypothetical protein NMY22_g17707 [Coprinellus aureogranulatus]